MQAITRYVDALLRALIMVLMAVMVIAVTWQVITRYVFSRPSSYTEELATFLLIWISLLGGAYALRVRAHLGIDVLVQRLQPARKRVAEYLVYLAVITFAIVVLIYGGARLMYVTLHLSQLSPAFQVPVGYVYSVIPFSGVLMVFYSVVGMLELRDQHDHLLTEEQVRHAPE
jgi:TRAP-type C4-dicarboxylate transport system permease small subunit